MGVVNVTPDSVTNLKNYSPLAQLKLLKSCGVKFLDIGAESTAPKSLPLTPQEEQQRFLNFLDQKEENVLELLFSFPILSIDTYHPETFHFWYELWQKNKAPNQLCLNDVSGKLEESFLNELSHWKNILLVVGHNNAPSRDLTGQHILYQLEKSLTQKEFFEILKKFFFDVQEKLLKIQFPLEKVFFDPGIGFSKNAQQSLWILESLEELIEYSTLSPSKWLLGFSRKSCLKEKMISLFPKEAMLLWSQEEITQTTEYLHFFYVQKLWQKYAEKILFRIHDPRPFMIF